MNHKLHVEKGLFYTLFGQPCLTVGSQMVAKIETNSQSGRMVEPVRTVKNSRSLPRLLDGLFTKKN